MNDIVFYTALRSCLRACRDIITARFGVRISNLKMRKYSDDMLDMIMDLTTMIELEKINEKEIKNESIRNDN